MWDLAVREEDYKAAETMVRRYPKAPLSFRIVPAYAQGDTAAAARMFEELRNLDARQSQIAGRFVATHLEDFQLGETLARLDLAERRNPAIQLGAQTFLAWLEVARGRWSGARAAFDRAAAMNGGQVVLTERAIAATLPFLDVLRSDVEDIRRAVDSWGPGAEQVAGGGLTQQLRPHLRLYLLGLLSSRLGETDRALRHAQELDRIAPPEAASGVVRALAATIRADVASRGGRHAEVLQLLQPANGEVPLELVWVKAFVNVREYTQEHARYLRAEALRALGRTDEARSWLETSFQGSPSELVYRAPVHLRLARIHQQRGETQPAVGHYRAFVSLWRDSDPALRRQVTDAEAEVARLRTP